MHDRHNHDRMNPEPSLAAALRSLPMPSISGDAWPSLAQRARRRRRTRLGLRAGVPAALAAGIALALLLPARPHQTATTAVRSIASATDSAARAAELAHLQSRSQRLQAWVRRLDADGAPLDGRALAGAVELQDQIGLVDLQLSVAHRAQTQARLWGHRIALLQRLALLHLAAGNDYVSTTHNARPALRNTAWTN